MDNQTDQNQTLVAPASQPINASQPSSPKFLMLIIVALIAALFASAGTYLALKQSNLPTQNVVQIAPSPTPTPDPTADWNIYTNQKYGYSVKYPDNLATNEDNTYYNIVNFTAKGSPSGTFPSFYFSVIADTFTSANAAAYNYLTADWINNFYSMNPGDTKQSNGTTIFTKLTDITVAGQNAIVIEADTKGDAAKQRRVYLKKNGYVYMLANFYQNSSELDNFQTFLSTFKFTDSSIGQGCVIGGCSGQLCTEEENDRIVSTCEWKEEYACYSTAKCEKQTNGKCDWTLTDGLKSCLQNNK